MTTTKRDKNKLRECWPPAAFVLVCLGTALLWFSSFHIKHPFRPTDITIEGSLLAAAILGWAFVLKLRLRVLSLGWAMFTYALFMDLLDEFTKEPELWNTIIPGILSLAALVIVAAGFYFSHRWVRGELARTQAAEASARENENRKRALLDALPDLVFRLSREGRFLDFHAPNDGLLFAQPAAFLGKALGEVMPAEIAARALLEVRATLDTRQMRIFDYQLDLPGQGLQEFEARMVAGGENEVLAVVRNVTEPRRAAERLRESERRLQQITDAVPGAVFQFQMGDDGAKRFNFFSRGALDLFGCTAEQLRGNSDLAWSLVVPEDRAAVNESIRASARSVMPWSAEFRVQTGGNQPKWIRGTSVPEPPRPDGTVVWNGFFVDISESKRAEAEKAGMERRLLESQKFESLGVMAGGIAHDFNNLLTGILGNASLARTDLPQDSPVQDFLKPIEAASLRAADLCKQMLAYAGRGQFESRNLNLSALVDDALPLLRLAVSQRATLEIDLRRDLPAVHADVTQMRQILMNLVINASEAFGEDSGSIFVSTGVQRADRAYLADTALAGNLAEGDYVFLRVRDTGAGMPPETAAKIFDPFFTTKFMGRGLGLAAVLGIVRGHNGGLKVESELGRGSTFTLLLPPVAGTPDAL